jgi:competence protein ComGC
MRKDAAMLVKVGKIDTHNENVFHSCLSNIVRLVDQYASGYELEDGELEDGEYETFKILQNGLKKILRKKIEKNWEIIDEMGKNAGKTLIQETLWLLALDSNTWISSERDEHVEKIIKILKGLLE